MNHANGLDALLAAAIRETIREDWERMASDPDIRPVRQPFRERMEGILSGKSGRKRAAARKIGIGVLVALSLLAMLGMAIRPVREAIREMFVEKRGDGITVRYSSPGNGPEKIEDYKEPALPEGYDRTELMRNDLCFVVRYVQNGTAIRFSQRVPGTGTHTVSSGSAVTYEAEVGGRTGQVIVSREGALETVSVFWSDGCCDYTLSGNLPAEEMLALAESVK